jgi:hypothetical protein
MASFKQALKQMILDFDATDDAVHGKQGGRFFHGIQIITAFYRYMCSARISCW